MRPGVVFACTALLFLSTTGVATAASGDVLRTLHPTVCTSGNYGMAVAGKALLVTCPVGPAQISTIYSLKSKNGKVAAIYTPSGLSSGLTIWGLGYDAQNKLIYVCASPGAQPPFQLGTVNPLTGAYQAVAMTTDCTGGLEVDQAHRLWSTPFDGTAVHEIDKTNGSTLKTYSVPLGSCGTGGVALEAGDFFLATLNADLIADCGVDDVSLQTSELNTFLPAGTSGVVVDLACDNKTFSAIHTAAIWAADAESSTLVAYEAPGSGGTTTPKCK